MPFGNYGMVTTSVHTGYLDPLDLDLIALCCWMEHSHDESGLQTLEAWSAGPNISLWPDRGLSDWNGCNVKRNCEDMSEGEYCRACHALLMTGVRSFSFCFSENDIS